MGNLEEAQKSYRDAIEKAKIELEENLGNSQAKRAFYKIREEFLNFLNELPLNEHLVSSSVQEKSAQVEYLFEKALSTLGSLELPNKPSLFLVYAHDNPSYGKAEAAISRYLIDKLSQIQVNLYSDQTPMGQPSSRAVEDWKEDGKLEDILTSQLCLLPTRLRNDVEPVDKVVVCCSEVLEKYLDWPHYGAFYRELREAYRKDREQKGTSAIRKVVKAFSQEAEYQAGFHHVLTEMAFLQIRVEQLKDQHGIIPVSLTPKSSKQCLGSFIASTTVRMEDISRLEEQATAGREVYLNQGQHLVLFKLIERLLVGSDEAQTFLNKFWQGYDKCVFRLNKESSTPVELEFTKLVDSIFGDIEKTLRDQLVLATLQQHKDKVEKLRLPNLSDLREASYQYYQRSNLSIQRVSGQTVSLDDCYINLAIVESQAQREKDKKELEKQAVTFERLPSSERQRLEATNPNKLIALDKLFESQKLRDGSEGIPKRILIQGRAGIGKTTLCKKLVYEYHHNGLWQDRFDSILWIPLRQLKTASPQHLEDLLCNRYFSYHGSVKAQALSKLFLEHQGKTLFILDGLDEVTEMFDQRDRLNHFLTNLLNQSHVLITSRPAGVNASQCNNLDLELETIGFSADNVQTYIQKFTPASNQTAIQQFIRRTPLIRGLVNIPIQLDALCYSWDRLPQNKEVTMSMLYEAMVDKLWRKDSVRLEKEHAGQLLGVNVIEDLSESDLTELMTAEIHYLSYLAFKGLETEKIEFSREELSQRRKELNARPRTGEKLPIHFTTNLKKTSYLHTADVERPESERHYHFLHLTFQEFFAAKFLVEHLQAYAKVEKAFAFSHVVQKSLSAMPDQNELEAFIATHKYNPRYEIVWWMVAGLLKGDPLERFFTLLEQSPRDLIGGCHQQVLMGCLSEARGQLNRETVIGLEKELTKWLYFDQELNNGRGNLGKQRAFPEHLLLTALNQSDNKKARIIDILCERSALSETAVQALIGACQDQDEDVRYMAVHALVNQNTLSGAAAQALIGACQDQEQNVRYVATWALGNQRTLSEAAVQALIGACQDQDKDVRYVAARALGHQSPLSEGAVQVLIGACQDQERSVRSEAASALGKQSPLSEATVRALISACQDQDKGVRSAAVSALGKQSPLSEAAVRALIGACQDQDKDVRSAAAHALKKQSPLSEAAVRALIVACQDQDEGIRDAAASVLERQSRLSEAAVQALIVACQDQDEGVRVAAASVLGKQSTLSEAAVQALISAFQDQDEGVRDAAASVLGEQSTLSETAAQALISACQHENKDVRVAAAWALGSLLSETAVKVLISACQDQDKGVRSAAARALGNQRTLCEVAVQTLIGACQDQDEGVRSEAAWALGKQSPLSEAAVQALIGACQDQDQYVRSEAASALGEQSTLSEAAVQALIGACQDQDKYVRSEAVRALGKQSTLSGVTVQALIGACQDQDQYVRSEAARALGKQSTLSGAAVQALIGACQHENKNVRYVAVNALREQSPLSEAAVQALIGACQDQDEGVRSMAAGALSMHVDLIYSKLPGLSSSQIEALYTEVLFKYSCEHIAPLYVQDDQLHFYTEKGLSLADVKELELEKIFQAFEAVQITKGLKPMQKEALLIKES